MATPQEIAQRAFDEQDKRWDGPKFFRWGAATLGIAILLIYLMARTTGCSLQIVP
jgi:hypothetical protein